ncbi:hypothetical protein [Thioclava kandeliae]|uniref:Uncharacterized protein n=1 Tax=Thioclava kandeliae TaxID=3070818 RepID=A0ABV1SFC4_9RHOB
MNATLETIHKIMRNMRAQIGTQEAAVAAIEAYGGRGAHLSLLSRKIHGSAEWTIADMMAFQSATGSTALTDYLIAEISEGMKGKTIRQAVNILAQSAVCSKECGEAISAAITCDDGDDEATSDALVEIAEARAALDKLEAAVKAKVSDGRLRAIGGSR